MCCCCCCCKLKPEEEEEHRGTAREKIGKRRIEILLQYDARLYQWKENMHKHMHAIYTHTRISQSASQNVAITFFHSLSDSELAQIFTSPNWLIAPHFHYHNTRLCCRFFIFRSSSGSHSHFISQHYVSMSHTRVGIIALHHTTIA